MTQEMDWDLAYRQEHAPAWSIGEPQPEYARLIEQSDVVRGEVLDAGCGHAELSLALAARGHTVVGMDLSPTAVVAATAQAAERGLANATFVQGDITSFTGFDGRFTTIFDSGLLHALPADLRDDYLTAVHRAAAPGATFYILAFGSGAFPGHTDALPTQFTEDLLCDVVSKRFQINELRPAFLYSSTGQLPHGSRSEPDHTQLPGYLVVATKAE